MIGKNIHEIRKKRGFTLSDLAERANISKSYLSNIERELNDNPSIQVLEKISAVLGVDLGTILGSESEPQLLQDNEWIDFINELKESGIEKENFQDYKTVFEFVKWQNRVVRREK